MSGVTSPVDVLYVHPRGHMNELVIPAGAITCMNSIRAPKLGRYAFEVADAEILAAKIMAVDVHWALALAGLEPLLRHVRELRPDLPIVVGGITASHYAEELLQQFPVDYVIQGDAEEAFPRLVDELLAGRRPTGLPNVHARDAPRPDIRRAGPDAFEQGDCLSAAWFPTYEYWADADAAAFPQGLTISVSRGCTLRCSTCYGSYAGTFGPGQLHRSPRRVAELVARATADGHRNLRLILGKPDRGRLTAVIAALADTGTHRLMSRIGLYCCTPPTREDLSRLAAAFPNGVVVSFVPPREHEPRLPDARVHREEQEWRHVADDTARLPPLHLDAWVTSRERLEPMRAVLGRAPRVAVNYGATWNLTRPVDGTSLALSEAIEAVRPLWTFYAARLLSPALARLLVPFALLDEVDPAADDFPELSDGMAGYRAELRRSYARHHLPMFPRLQLDIVQLSEARSLQPAENQRRLRGDLDHVEYVPHSARRVLPLQQSEDHRGVDLRCSIDIEGPQVLALSPAPLPAGQTDDSWLQQVARWGLVALRVGDVNAHATLVVHLRVQQAQVALLDEEGELIAGGSADLVYYPRRPTGRPRT